MPLQLYGHRKSRTFRCIWMLEEASLPYELIVVGESPGNTHDPAYLRINPNGRIPALVDGDLIMYESLAINLYLARCYATRMIPRGQHGDALAERWSFWAMGELEGPADAMAHHAPAPKQWPERPLQVLDQSLAASEYLVGNEFSVADINVAVMLARPAVNAYRHDELSHLKRWLNTCRQRPAYLRSVA